MDIWTVRVIVWVASLLLGVIRGVHSYRKPATTVVASRRGALETIILAVSIVGFIVPLAWAVSTWLHDVNYPPLLVVQLIGLLFIGGGLVLFNRTHVDIGKNWSATLQIARDQELITTGIYARVRHPMYLSLIVFALGESLLIPNWVAGPACLIGCIVLAGLRMRAEERMLVERFGKAYRDYAARTPAIFPRLTAL